MVMGRRRTECFWGSGSLAAEAVSKDSSERCIKRPRSRAEEDETGRPMGSGTWDPNVSRKERLDEED